MVFIFMGSSQLEVGVQVAREAQTDSRHSPWKPSLERDEQDPELAAILRKVKCRDWLQNSRESH